MSNIRSTRQDYHAPSNRPNRGHRDGHRFHCVHWPPGDHLRRNHSAVLQDFTRHRQQGAHDFDPVTEADRAAKAVMRRMIQGNFPNSNASSAKNSATSVKMPNMSGCWINRRRKSFISGFPTWGTLIALMHKKTPVFGLMHQPYITANAFPAIAARRTIPDRQASAVWQYAAARP